MEGNIIKDNLPSFGDIFGKSSKASVMDTSELDSITESKTATVVKKTPKKKPTVNRVKR